MSATIPASATGVPWRIDEPCPETTVEDRGSGPGIDGLRSLIDAATRPARAAARAAVFFLKVFPMLPSRPVDWVTEAPVIQKVKYSTLRGEVEGEVYRPPTAGPHPGIVVCLGVVPFGAEHPQVPVLGRALARAGFAALLYWSPSMRNLRLDPDDVESIALAYDWLVEQPYVDPARSGLMGTCVGGAFALMAASTPRIRDRVGFVSAYAPYYSMQTFARDIASESCDSGEGREPWQVDQLTRRVFVHSITSRLLPDEGEQLRVAFEGERGEVDASGLSDDAQAVHALLSARTENEVERALRQLPAGLRDDLAAVSPLNYLKELRAPVVVLLHDRGDRVVPVGESRRLLAGLAGRSGVHYTEMLFQHLDPIKGNLSPHRLARELGKLFLAIYPIFQRAGGA